MANATAAAGAAEPAWANFDSVTVGLFVLLFVWWAGVGSFYYQEANRDKELRAIFINDDERNQEGSEDTAKHRLQNLRLQAGRMSAGARRRLSVGSVVLGGRRRGIIPMTRSGRFNPLSSSGKLRHSVANPKFPIHAFLTPAQQEAHERRVEEDGKASFGQITSRHINLSRVIAEVALLNEFSSLVFLPFTVEGVWPVGLKAVETTST